MPAQITFIIKIRYDKILELLYTDIMLQLSFFFPYFRLSSATSLDQDLKGKGYGFGFWG